MNPDWRAFLIQRGVTIKDEVVQRVINDIDELIATRDGTVLCDLSQFGTLHVIGEDAQGFLQNLLSNDIREVSQTHAQYSSLNNNKGRMLASKLIWGENGRYVLKLPHSLCEYVRKKLSMYVLRAKVQISNVSEEFVTIGLSGAAAAELLHTRFSELPHEMLGICSTEDASVIKIDETRWQILTTPSRAQSLWLELSANARPAGGTCWDWLNIRAGIPVILPQTQEQFVAQMVNFDLINGVSFGKGCYPGQEIVARTRYLGKLKRRMYLAHIDSASSPQAGDELFSADMDGQSSGMIVNSAASPSGGYDVLAVVQISSVDEHPVCIGSLQGAPLAFQILPYAIT